MMRRRSRATRVGSSAASDVYKRQEQEWSVWNPGVPLRILHTEYASVVRPIVAFIDEAREDSSQQIVVLIPVAVPEHVRYRILHNHVDRVLSAALRTVSYTHLRAHETVLD